MEWPTGSTEYIKDSSNTGSESHHLEEQSNEITKIGPNVMFCNIQGLYNQTDLTKPKILLDIASLNDAFCVCLCETHLSDNVLDSEIVSPGWNIIRSDRKDRICGGSAILINENVPISEKFTFSNSVCDAVAIFLPLSLSTDLHLAKLRNLKNVLMLYQIGFPIL